MMKHEFEKLAGYEVTAEDYYNIIEPMYIACDLDKLDFIQTLNKKRFALRSLKSVVNDMKKTAAAIKSNCTHFIDSENYKILDDLALEYMKRVNGVSYRIEQTELLYNGCYHSTCYYPCKVIISKFNTYEEITL